MITTKKNIWKTVAVVILAITVAFTFMPMMGGEANAASKAKKAKKAYKQFLKNAVIYHPYCDETGEKISVDMSKCKFQVVDINKDKVPELVLRPKGGIYYEICTYRKGQIKSITNGVFMGAKLRYYPKAKAFSAFFNGEYVYKIKKGKAKWYSGSKAKLGKAKKFKFKKNTRKNRAKI